MPKRRRERFGPAVTFGAALRERRKELGLSQERFAAKAKLDRTYVGGLERGERNPMLRVIWRLADALEMRPGDLVHLADKKVLGRPTDSA